MREGDPKAAGFLPSLGAALVMGVAVTGMHYPGMSGLAVRLHEAHGSRPPGGDTAVSIMLPMMVGPLAFMLLAAVVVMFDPVLVLGEGEWTASPSSASPGPPGPGVLRTIRPRWTLRFPCRARRRRRCPSRRRCARGGGSPRR